MSLSYKILGQELVSYTTANAPDSNSGYGYGYNDGIGDFIENFLPVTVYTVPENKQTTVTSIFVANHNNDETTYDLAIIPAGEELSLKHHIRWDMAIAANDFENISTKITMSTGDRLVIFPSTVDTVSITAFGVEK
jgi:hypothetical protein